MFNFKNLKIVKQLKTMRPKLKWLMFSQMQDYKINSNYIDMICADGNKTVDSDGQKLEAIVKDTLIKEFSPKIQEMKSFEFLVDTVVHNLKKKQLADTKD